MDWLNMRAFVLAALAGWLGLIDLKAGHAVFNFDDDPRGFFEGLKSNQKDVIWSEDGEWAGMGNPGGFLSITEATPNTSTVVLFKDVNDGQLVRSFNLKADLRVGNGVSDRPGDGFSMGFARVFDSVLDGSFGLPGPPENGTRTGVVVSFDSWKGDTLTDGSGDLEGIIVVVDGEAVSKTPLPVSHGECDDIGSLQTGPQGSDDLEFPRGDPRTLCWAPLEIDMTQDGRLSVLWKGIKILEDFQSNFFPSPGQLFIAGQNRRGDQMVHVDNIELQTILDGEIIECFGPGVRAQVDGIDFEFSDLCYRDVDISRLRITLDGVLVTTFDTARTSDSQLLSISLEEPFQPGSEHSIEIVFPGGHESQMTFTLPNYAVVGAEHALKGSFVNRGFNMRVLQSPIAIGNNTQERELHLLGEIRDADGNPVENLVDSSGAVSNGEVWEVVSFINFNQRGNPQGVFRADGSGSSRDVPDGFIPGIPGIEGGADNITAEILTVVEIPSSGLYNFAFNSDDGFKTTAGHVNEFGEAIVISEFSGGRGASTTFGLVFFEEPGFYRLRTLWYQGAGEANLEWWTADLEGNPIALLNDDVDGGLKTFRDIPEDPAAIVFVSPPDGANEVSLDGLVLSIGMKDGITSFDAGSAIAMLNGVSIPVSETTLEGWTVLTAETGELDGNTAYSWEISFTAGGVGRSARGSFRSTILAGDGLLFIETEDFNYGLGQWDRVNEIGMNGPFLGGTYQDLGDGVDETDVDAGTSYGVDYFESNNANSQAVYRPGTGVEAGRPNGASGTFRGEFDVEVNHVVGWNDAGDWFNYTRDFPEPARDYNIFGRLSSGGATIDVSLLEVSSTANTSIQETHVLGHWSPGRSTAGWDNYEMFPLVDDAGDVVSVRLGGESTLRYLVNGGNNDHDFIVFIPIGDKNVDAREVRVVRLPNGDIRLEYTGVLHSSGGVSGPYAPVVEATSPHLVSPSQGREQYYIAR